MTTESPAPATLRASLAAGPGTAHGITLAFLLSGAAGLILEVIWTRLLHLAFGANAPAVSTVLAVYMGGMALGAYAVSRLPRLRRWPLHTYAVLELGVAVLALLLPSAIEAVAPLHRALTAPLDATGSLVPLLVVRALLVGSLLLLPTAAMGATLPLLAEGARQQVRRHRRQLQASRAGDQDAGPTEEAWILRRVGVLYAVNLSGAVIGAGVVGFVLIPMLGLTVSNRIAAALDLAAAALAWRAARGIQGEVRDEVPAALLAHRRSVLLALGCLALTGGLAMQLQVLWSRALSVVIGSSTYAFSLILVVTLLGMALGGRIVAGRADQGGPRRALVRLGLLFGIAALGVFVGTLLIDKLPSVIRDAARMPQLSPTLLFGVELLVIGAVVLVPATALGGSLPGALQVARRDVRRSAAGFVGQAYAVNTVGAIVGSALGGFVTIPLLGVDAGLRLTSLCYAGMAAVLVTAAQPRRARWDRSLRAPALATGLAVLVLVTPDLDVMRWSSGFFRVYLPRTYRDDDDTGDRLLFHRDGIVATVTVEDNVGSIALKVNGKVDASSRGDMPTQILSGLLPLAFLEPPARSAVIGFGSGVTVGALLQTPVGSVDLVELEPHVLEAGRLFSHVNHQPWNDPRVRMIVDDGRNYLERGGAAYDLIISEPSNPWMTGASSLFTREFWSIAHERLSADGVFLQWVQLYELGEDRIRSLVGTFSGVFEHVVMFASNPGSSDTFMIGSRRPLRIDMDRVRRLFSDPATAESLHLGDVEDPAELLALLLLVEDDVRAFGRGAVINTDDNAYVEFRAPLDLVHYALRDPDLSPLKVSLGHRMDLIDRIVQGPLVLEEDPCLRDLELSRTMGRRGLLDDALSFLDRAESACGEDPTFAPLATRQREVLQVLVGDDVEAVVDPELVEEGDLRYLRVVAHMIDGHNEVALSDLEAVAELDSAPPGWLLLWAYLCYSEDRLDDAQVLFARLLDQPAAVERLPAISFYAARSAFSHNKFRDAERLARHFVEATAVRRGRDRAVFVPAPVW
ncbi:MAG: fused MFS/spermidine synthase [Pseudomonadota bacterium]